MMQVAAHVGWTPAVEAQVIDLALCLVAHSAAGRVTINQPPAVVLPKPLQRMPLWYGYDSREWLACSSWLLLMCSGLCHVALAVRFISRVRLALPNVHTVVWHVSKSHARQPV
jgi:hypothetical protein